jgi:AcrR family transcriptional regulator
MTMTRGTITRAEQAERTRQRILETAQRLFAEQSYDAVSLQMIADAMDVAKANVYYYFHTKAEILGAITEPAVAAMTALFDAAEGFRGKRQRTEYLIDGYVSELIARRAVGALSNNDPALRRVRDLDLSLELVRERGLFVLFGDHPTPEQRVAYQLLDDVRDSVYLLRGLPDDQARQILTQACQRIIRIPKPKVS